MARRQRKRGHTTDWAQPNTATACQRLETVRAELNLIREQLGRLGSSEGEMSGDLLLLGKQVERLETELTQDVRDIDQALSGNGQVGMKVRLDRLEQAEKRRVRNSYLLWGAIVAAVVNAVVAWLAR